MIEYVGGDGTKLDGLSGVCVHVCMHVCMHACIYEYNMYVCMYLCVCPVHCVSLSFSAISAYSFFFECVSERSSFIHCISIAFAQLLAFVKSQQSETTIYIRSLQVINSVDGFIDGSFFSRTIWIFFRVEFRANSYSYDVYGSDDRQIYKETTSIGPKMAYVYVILACQIFSSFFFSFSSLR
jgi:hypothetical protein